MRRIRPFNQAYRVIRQAIRRQTILRRATRRRTTRRRNSSTDDENRNTSGERPSPITGCDLGWPGFEPLTPILSCFVNFDVLLIYYALLAF